MSTKTSSDKGIGICGLTFIVFLVLKLAEIGTVALWSWWWVFAPIWIPVAFIILIAIIYGICKGISNKL